MQRTDLETIIVIFNNTSMRHHIVKDKIKKEFYKYGFILTYLSITLESWNQSDRDIF